jgi:hypothetical protein
MVPFVLRGCTELPPEPAPHSHYVFDKWLQVWVNTKTSRPVVVEMQHRQSEFGETLITATAEGVDQSEATGLDASEFGETSLTRSTEGVDQSEGTSFEISQFGETTMTKSPGEGVDYDHFGSFASSVFGESTKMTIREAIDAWSGQDASNIVSRTDTGAIPRPAF